ncbi:MAG: hypothetical protein MI919_40560, partial [Holophagales bacterium]|nr:hypothetical protein [Holophagales bacterium]
MSEPHRPRSTAPSQVRAAAENHAEDAVPRTLAVPPSDRRHELIALSLLLADLMLLATMRAGAMERHNAAEELASYEMAATELPAEGRVLVQALEGSSADVADFLHQAPEEGEGIWPTPDDLAAAAVPPFDPAFLPPGLRHLEAEAGLGAHAWNDLVVRLHAGGDGALRGAFVLRMIRREVPA